VNNNFFKNQGSQIKTVSVIVHTPITSLFKGAQLMNYVVWVLILLCCATTKYPVRQCFFMHCLHYVAKLKQVWVFFYSFFTQMEEKKLSIACVSFRLCWKMSFYVRSICLRNLLFKHKRMKKNLKQKTGFRWKCVLKSMFILLFTRINNEQSSIVSKISIYLARQCMWQSTS